MGKQLLNSSCVMGILLSPGRAKNKRFFYFLGILIEKSSLGKHLVSRILLLMANTRRMEIFYWAFRNPVFSTLFLFYTLLNSGHIDLSFHVSFFEEELKESNIKFLIVISDNSI